MIEVIWKLISIIFDWRLAAAIELHVVLHGFQVKWGTGTATLETKLLHKISEMNQEVMYDIFVDICKACDVLDRKQALVILEGYGVGPQVHQLLALYLDRAVMMVRDIGYCGYTFHGFRGVI